MNGMLCHVCGSPDIFEVHTVYMVKNPAVMVNIGYCKKCGEYINTTEQALHRYNTHKKYEETEKMDGLVTIPDTIAGGITAVTSVEPTERGVRVTIGTHTYVLDLDTAKALRDQLKVAIGSVE